MGESQSRYSIVERLTQRKLDIMTAKSDLKEELKHKEQKIEELKKDLENWNKDVEEDIKRERRKKERDIEKTQQNYENAKDRLIDKEKIYDDKVKGSKPTETTAKDWSRMSRIVQKIVTNLDEDSLLNAVIENAIDISKADRGLLYYWMNSET